MSKSLEFTNASPDKRAEMIADGFEHLAATVRGMHANLFVLNNWIEQLPMLIHEQRCEFPDMKAITKTAKALGDSHDDLTDEFVRHAQVLKKFSDYVKTRKV